MQANKQLSGGTNTDVEVLREELIACKVREAEKDLLTKELKQKVTELDKLFQVCLFVLVIDGICWYKIKNHCLAHGPISKTVHLEHIMHRA